ncbi:MAG: protein-export membrane protein SecF [Deltaproteobacteria bacterium RIFCSPHIGHO2_02_FULL_40_11]|nr:MAG: protein-export membrane protein SecF [Deltaproteobacteria bacterium RIFCSPHIGHO2_02_FULL_40_11]
MSIEKTRFHIDFMGKSRLFIGVSLALIVLALYAFIVKGMQFGIDFAGGTEIHIAFKQATSSLEVRDLLSKAGFKDSVVQHFGEKQDNEFLIHLASSSGTMKSVSDEMIHVFETAKGKDTFEITKVDMVGPKVGSDLKKRGAWAMFYALLGILIYVALRFDYRFSPGSVIALIHDVIITLGIFILVGKKFDLTILAAVLTLVGYSVNDTIVVFDRIRENMQSFEGLEIKQLINRSINETLSRTLMTSFTTLLVVAALFVWGGEVIHDFAFTLLIGIIVGTYSSIFIASPVFLALYQRSQAKA